MITDIEVSDKLPKGRVELDASPLGTEDGNTYEWAVADINGASTSTFDIEMRSDKMI